ncbi:threonine--tRNA ligase [Gynuella sunshinyii]|uniref:Threonine--tRNA ligase n=1 Tax=Gynuella sunshinyii YC6258 TaxID=1445510 RepID=A0A0C5VGK0_9GAMM|nr:threonine--tRNA ligase [Gynuella sunshinyii]AJQ93311.1 threonyl-tRNA synthetase [Gynuella sunshinyii YC6258]
MKSHRDIGEKLDLFHSEPQAPGMMFWHPDGWRLFQNIENHMRTVYLANNFSEVRTPQFMKKELWQISGHLEKFADNMFMGGDADMPDDYALKPMSCPAHILYFQRGVHSYRELPIKLFEFGLVHRNEPSGALNGCLRLRQFTQDDAHVFCDWEQADAEIIAFIERAQLVYRSFGYHDFQIKVSTQPENAFGSNDDWRRAEQLLAKACQQAGHEFEWQVGEGAFYGPKIEISLRDSMGREWQCGTIQCDFNLPQRFDLSYVNEQNAFIRPVILHQAMYGSIERWIGILLENYQGILPAWIHPLPVAIAAVTEASRDYVQSLQQQLQSAGIASRIDVGSGSVSRKIKRFYQYHVPVMMIVGEQEADQQTVQIRLRDSKETMKTLNRDELVSFIRQQIHQPVTAV